MISSTAAEGQYAVYEVPESNFPSSGVGAL